MGEAGKGIVAIVAACTIWGLATLYYKAMAHVPPLEVLAHRTLWTLVFFGVALALRGRIGEAVALLRGAQRGRVRLAAGIVAVNWGLFIWAIQTGHAVQASLGYYIFPLVSVCLGVLVLGERLSRGQGAAVALACGAVGVLTAGLGVAPWVALALAVTFAPYMLIKKQMRAGAAVSVTAEVMLLLPLALVWLALAHGGVVAGGLFGADAFTTWMLPLSGLITGGPLILFSWGAQRVRLSTLGLVQYLNPTLQAVVAVLVFREPFTGWHAVAFGMIWGALALYSLEGWRQERAARNLATSEGTSGTVL
ncbi:EamA family transporter RarD [Rhodobacteraceae bacterium HSP-20]|uniref:EamA family transporter RarD n=1 Tax=Paragemmobacter amnigenus TaxID=2852097 RepID=A0ABS6J6Z0_9RHOB|nr:EamA family transporter RarD [Rhodobacter amnigenus]MBU9699504.1 EamA family transporter RarD [Rhodobacter amnigenus]MBV4390731.1 EamA family transporter RarD [Rhodobacter amnigenus]